MSRKKALAVALNMRYIKCTDFYDEATLARAVHFVPVQCAAASAAFFAVL